MTTTPIVALQRPKDISLGELESELQRIWQQQGGASVTRSSTFTMVIYEPEEVQQILAALGFYQGTIDGIHGPLTRAAINQAQVDYDLRLTGRMDPPTLARVRQEYAQLSPSQQQYKNSDQRGFNLSASISAHNPCRVISLCPTFGEDRGVTAQVSAYCPVHKKHGGNLICCEYITLRGTKAALERVGDLVSSLIVEDLPRFVWWKATPSPEQPIFQNLARSSNCVIVDSSYFSDAEAELRIMEDLIQSGLKIADLNWHRLAPWLELSAAAYDPPERRQAIEQIDRMGIDYEQGNAAQALMYLGWFASRLGWQPADYIEEGGIYNIKKIHFHSPQDRLIEAELAGIPVADSGEVIGDLTGLRLMSTDPDANCCTILCSETSGCMRMEAGGGAQNCQVEQVTALSDQKADFMLGQQLQRWGEDVLYEESLAMVASIMELLGKV
jgi:glucose-6-phosphate dehydrogenase assembly protein OpcA